MNINTETVVDALFCSQQIQMILTLPRAKRAEEERGKRKTKKVNCKLFFSDYLHLVVFHIKHYQGYQLRCGSIFSKKDALEPETATKNLTLTPAPSKNYLTILFSTGIHQVL